MDNDKDIEIKREEDLGLDEKIKAGAKAVGRKIGDPESDIDSEYGTKKLQKEYRRLRKYKEDEPIDEYLSI